MNRVSKSTLALLLLLCFGPLASAPALSDPGKAQPTTVWVTMGQDAFETLRNTPGILSELQAPVAEQARAGVVMTRLNRRDLPAVSALMHEEYKRCGGFIVHPSYDDASSTLARLEQPSAKMMSPFNIGQSPRVNQVLPYLEASEILGTISHLSTAYNNRYYLNNSGEQSALWIRDLWAGYAASRPDVTVETYNHAFIQPSVILTIPGATVPNEEVVVGAHLDSINTDASNDEATIAPGADDDGSGIATISEVIRGLLDNGFTPDRTVRFMGYAAEEVGLVGSGEIAQDAVDAGTNVVAVMQLDMTAFNGSVEDIGIIDDYTDTDLSAFVGSLADEYLPELVWTYTTCGYACSDHASWTNRGYPAVFPFETKFVDYNKDIHTPDDTLATVGNNADHSLKFAKLAAAFVIETAYLDCTVDADCDDGLWCNGAETCSAGACQAGSDPCGGGACDEAQQICTSICGDGTCDPGEDCNGCALDCPSFPLPTAVCGNGLCEAGDGEDCVTCAQDCDGAQSGNPNNRFCCGFGGTNPVGCSDARCTTGGFSCTETPQGAGGSTCCGDLFCDDPEDSLNCALDCGAPGVCGDGTCDANESACSCAQDCGMPAGSEFGLCGDGIDNDCDLDMDCDDVDCAGDAACQAVDCSTFLDKNSCNAEATCRWDNRGKVCVPN